MSQSLTQELGDSVAHGIRLKWKGRPFIPGNAWALVFTVKLDKNDPDEDRIFQKTSGGGGITTSGADAVVRIVRPDTMGENDDAPIASGEYYWDIQASEVANPSNVQTVAKGTIEFEQDVTRNVEATGTVYSVNPPLLFFSYQSYLAGTTDDPVLTEEQWVSRLGSSNPDIVSTYPPLPSNNHLGRTFAVPYEGLQWFDPSDGATSVWMWLDPDATNDNESFGTFVSQFPTPVSGEIPDGAMQDENGAYYVDENGAYYVLT